jgi:hypothetical protein
MGQHILRKMFGYLPGAVLIKVNIIIKYGGVLGQQRRQIKTLDLPLLANIKESLIVSIHAGL